MVIVTEVLYFSNTYCYTKCRTVRFNVVPTSTIRVIFHTGIKYATHTAAHLLGLRVRIPPGAWMVISCKCYYVEVSARADHSPKGVLPSVVCLKE
jgi:hypothetical protein